MGLGGVLSKFISSMIEPEIGGFDGFLLPDPVNTWYKSSYDDYMGYIRTAECDEVLAAH